MPRALLVVASMACAAPLVVAQSVEEFDAWMQTIDEKTMAVQQSIASRDAARIAADAKALEEAFARVEAFWTHRPDAADAVALSTEARERAAAVVVAAGTGDFDGASTQSIRMADTCTSCHRLYRPLP